MKQSKTFKDISRKGTCDVCGKETDVVVCCSSMGAISFAYCEDCMANYREPYSVIVSCVACCGRWPDDINESYQELIRKNLEYYGKSEEEFSKDVDNW